MRSATQAVWELNMFCFVHVGQPGMLLAVFAYGQTGSGKTYTMGSAFTPGGNTQGVIPKVMDSIFQRINSSKDAEYTVRVGFVEIHKVHPLLFHCQDFVF